MTDLPDVCLATWPAEKSRPTQTEVETARQRYSATCHPNDMSDWCLGLGFVMATYNRLVWWRFFFPEEEAATLAQWREMAGEFADLFWRTGPD